VNLQNGEDSMVTINKDEIFNYGKISCHLASEKYFRVELRRINEHDIYNNYKMENENLMLLILEGEIEVKVDNKVVLLNNNTPQIIITENEVFSVKGISPTIVEYIWSPGLYG